MRIVTTLLIACLARATYAGYALTYENDAPDENVSVRKTVSGPVTASILVTEGSPDSNLFAPGEVYLKIEDRGESWWVNTPQPFDSMDIIQFVDTTHLLITLHTPVASSTAVLNLEDRSLYLIASGTGELIASDQDDPLIHLRGQRGYADGVYWYRSITDLQGRVIEFLPNGDSCIPIAELIASDADISRLTQPLDHCVSVSR